MKMKIEKLQRQRFSPMAAAADKQQQQQQQGTAGLKLVEYFVVQELMVMQARLEHLWKSKLFWHTLSRISSCSRFGLSDLLGKW